MQMSVQNIGILGLSALGVASAFLLLIHAKATLYKAKLLLNTVVFFIGTRDMSWKNKSTNRELSQDEIVSENVKTLVFLRHGESTWNNTFNKSKNPIFFIPRILYACSYELHLLLSGVRDSWFYDSPLSKEGIEQSEKLSDFLSCLPPPTPSNYLLHCVNGTSDSSVPRSVIVSSNLRRSLSTAAIGLYKRIIRTEETIFVHHSLQEISRNPDTLSITPAKVQPQPSWIEKGHPSLDIPKLYESQLHVQQNEGSKGINSTGKKRLDMFNEWVFSTFEEDVIVVSGHSLWFRHYFREFLPVECPQKGKNGKIRNSGLISMKVSCKTTTSGEKLYEIDPSSIQELYLGFA